MGAANALASAATIRVLRKVAMINSFYLGG
jgi:hypothetical protein